MKRRNSLKLLILFSVIGLLISVYQTYEHYFLASTICDVSQTFACSPVTESRFGDFPVGSNVATAFWGILWWGGLAGFSWLTMKGKNIIEEQDFYLLGYISTGLAFVAYLLVVEFYILPQETGSLAVCPFCTAQHVLIFASLLLGYSVMDGTIRGRVRSALSAEGGGIAGLDPKPVFMLVWAILLLIGMFPILGTGELEGDHYELADCLADNNATMYGFDACPHCNRQKTTIGREAFKLEIEDRGFYVRCQPRSEASEKLGERASKLSSVEPLEASMTQGDACTINVGAGTPTWVIDGEKYAGSQSLDKLANASGCPVPEE